jgi:hypothetical protein
MNTTDPIALRVARRHTKDLMLLRPNPAAGRVSREYIRRREGLVPVDEDEDAIEAGDDGRLLPSSSP